MSPNFLVTGGAGFIGSHIVAFLLRKKAKVVVLDNLSTGHTHNLAPHASDPNFRFIEGDIRTETDVREAMSGVDYVLHHAAVASVPYSVQHPRITHDVNVNGTLLLLDVARAMHVQRFVLASSSAVYGNCAALPLHEDAGMAPCSPYAVSKHVAEQYCRMFFTQYDVPTVSLRYFNVFGPGQDPASPYAAAIPQFIDRMRRGIPPVIFGDGMQSRDFIYVENIASTNYAVCQSSGVVGETFNIGSGDSRTILDLVNCLRDILAVDITPHFDNARIGDIKDSVASIEKARRLFSFSVGVHFLAGLQQTVAWQGFPSK